MKKYQLKVVTDHPKFANTDPSQVVVFFGRIRGLEIKVKASLPSHYYGYQLEELRKRDLGNIAECAMKGMITVKEYDSDAIPADDEAFDALDSMTAEEILHIGHIDTKPVA